MNQKVFWTSLLILATVADENLAHWLLAIFVGDMGVVDGFRASFQHFSLTGYLFFSLFRAIPYVLLAIVVAASVKKDRWAVGGIAWGGLVAIALTIVYLSWISLEPLYTEAHASSTTAIAFLFIPFYAIATGIVGSLAGVVLVYVKRKQGGEQAH